MIARLVTALSKISPAALWLGLAVITGALLLEAWVLVLRQPVATYRQLRADRETLRAIEQMTATQDKEMHEASARSKQLAERLGSALQSATPEEQLTVSLMRQLDQGAARAGITLTSLKPAGRKQVLAFEEVSFDVGAQGKYLALCQWLLNFEQALGKFATVTDLTMKSSDEGRQVSLSLRLALYRLPASGERK